MIDLVKEEYIPELVKKMKKNLPWSIWGILDCNDGVKLLDKALRNKHALAAVGILDMEIKSGLILFPPGGLNHFFRYPVLMFRLIWRLFIHGKLMETIRVYLEKRKFQNGYHSEAGLFLEKGSPLLIKGVIQKLIDQLILLGYKPFALVVLIEGRERLAKLLSLWFYTKKISLVKIRKKNYYFYIVGHPDGPEHFN